jgi:hypothetical protein
MGDLMGDGWNGLIVTAMKQVQDLGKCAGFDALDKEATDQLRTLPLYTALMLFNKLHAEEKMKNISAFIVENARRLRNNYGLDEVQTILDANKGMYNCTNDDGTETEDDDEKAAAPEIKKEKEAKTEVKIKQEKEDNAEVKIKQEKKDDDVVILD